MSAWPLSRRGSSRSAGRITGDGVRETLREIGERIPLDVHEVAERHSCPRLDGARRVEHPRTHTSRRPTATRVVDFQESNLHVVSYSEPVRCTMPLDELSPHLHTHAEEADWIPYRTSYYTRTWGFCLAQRKLDELEDGQYEVVVDSTLGPGSLTYGEYVMPGESQTRCC